MKILILYTYNQGLLSGFFQELSEKLSNDGHEVVNFYLKHKKDHFEQNGISIYSEKRAGFFKNYYHIYGIIKETRPDVVVSNFSYINPAVLFGRLLGVKRNIAWFHTSYEHTQPSTFKVINKTFYLKLATVVIANSSLLEEELHRIYKVSHLRTRCVPFWTNISSYDVSTQSSKGDVDILHVGCPGRLLEDKNHQTVIRTIHFIVNHHSKAIRLHIAGGGPYLAELKKLVSSLHMEAHVKFLGVLSVEEMVTFYHQMDVMVLPSLNEAFGLVFIEAIALGRPVLVSSQFGALNFIDTERFPLQDFTFNPKSIDDLCSKLLKYANNEGMKGDFFEILYRETFDKNLIYEKIKTIITATSSA